MLKKLIAMAAAVSIAACTVPVHAKSYDLINGNMDYRRKLISENALKCYVKSAPENYVYYGAKFEPRAGIYIGTPEDRQYSGIGNGIYTQYDWFVPSEEIKNANCARNEIAEKQSEHTLLRGYNWNFALKNSQVIDITEYSNYLYNKIDELAARGEDILLIFGKEFNIDDNFNDPELFKQCFRFVADYAHTKENIAMVWAPNDTGGLDTTLEEFYPGDEYVDWIGCSLYSLPYFQGNPNIDDGANMAFIMGKYANPSMRAKLIHDFMEKNGIRKPVFVTEGGVGFESPDGTDYTDWAEHQLRMYYADICRAYPEFKCIVSFNQYVTPGDLYRYDLGNSPRLLSLLQELTKDPIYLQTYPSSAPYSYTELYDGMVFTHKVNITAYAYEMAKPNLTVRYLLDGEWLSEKSEPPYEINLDNEHISYGWHTLTCEVYNGEKISQKRDYSIALAPREDNYAYAETADEGKTGFIDMENKPAEMKNAAYALREQGIITGVDDTHFNPDDKISRSQMAAILMRLMGLKESDKPSGLTDVSADDWYYGIINAAVEAGLIDGYEDSTFRGGATITRNEFVTIIAKIVLREKNVVVPDIDLGYTDEIAGWVTDYLKVAKNSGLVLERNDGIFSGTSEVTRGDAAIMTERLYKLIKN